MTAFERAGLAILHRLDPERAHGLSIRALQAGLVPLPGPHSSPRLVTDVAGLVMPNPVGLAAGYDKNAQVIEPLQRAGFGFVEIGAATPRAQTGNPRPRLFRLSEDSAVINRFGFNNDGVAAITRRLERVHSAVPLGLNLGANKDSADRAGDYVTVLATAGAHVDFVTVNVSSPNTEKLRDLQGKAALGALLARVTEARAQAGIAAKVFLKIAPDLDGDEISDIAEVVNANDGISGVIATNTTLSRVGLKSIHAKEAGGLSGAPLFERSTRVVAQLSALTSKPIIGVGGVGSAEQAYQKIRAGAAAVQLYSALVYHGLSLVSEIARGLDSLLARDGFGNVAEAVGTGRDDWI